MKKNLCSKIKINVIASVKNHELNYQSLGWYVYERITRYTNLLSKYNLALYQSSSYREGLTDACARAVLGKLCAGKVVLLLTLCKSKVRNKI